MAIAKEIEVRDSRRKRRIVTLAASLAALLLTSLPSGAQTPQVRPARLVEQNGAYRLLREGKPYFIKGAGGDGSRALLRSLGGNSIRTWGVDNLGAVLDEAEKSGLTVCAGIWLGHKEHGFDYSNGDQVAEQYEKAREAVMKYRNHPALLLWSLGNEMEISAGADNAAVWSAVNSLGAMVHKLDPNHPTMTVVAEIGGGKVKYINRLCPEIDIIGINSYGGGPSIAKRYREAGGVKPFIITEFGPAGVWETEKGPLGAYPELTSTAKAAQYRATYTGSIAEQPLCLGSYAFAWGFKQEATATWFGLLLPDGSRLGATDALSELWTGKPPSNRCPQIVSLKADGPDQGDPGAKLHVSLNATDPDGDPLDVKWVLQSDASEFHSNGSAETAPPVYPEAIAHATPSGADITLPRFGGLYRLFAYIRDGHGNAAVGNVPIMVRGGEARAASPAAAGKLPFVVYDEAERADPVYVPSGFMGNYAAAKINERCTVKPHSGKTCIQAQYSAKDNWAGVVWQSPANDWGDKPGGRSLTGAKRLSFWVRGEKGGEVITFLCGVIHKDKPYYDTVNEKLEKVALTPEWKQYTIDLTGKDVSRIKTGFGWVVAGSGEPITFYLDDIVYE